MFLFPSYVPWSACNCFTVHELTVISYIWLCGRDIENAVPWKETRVSRSGSVLRYLQLNHAILVRLRLLKSLLFCNNQNLVGRWLATASFS